MEECQTSGKKVGFKEKKPYFNELEKCDKMPPGSAHGKIGRIGRKDKKRGQSMRIVVS
jgi:hypothetical protein